MKYMCIVQNQKYNSLDYFLYFFNTYMYLCVSAHVYLKNVVTYFFNCSTLKYVVLFDSCNNNNNNSDTIFII